MSQTSSDPLRFLQILETMDVPDRRKLLSRANIGWLQRNIRVRNADHPDLDELLTILRRLRKNRLVT